MTEERIGRQQAEKERGLLEMDYATPCPLCGGVVFDWWDSDTCRDCDRGDDGVDTKQSTLITDGGSVEGGIVHVWVTLRDSGAVEHYFGSYPRTAGADEIWFWSVNSTANQEVDQ